MIKKQSTLKSFSLGHPKEGLYNSAEQKNSVCLSDVCLWDQSYNRLIPF